MMSRDVAGELWRKVPSRFMRAHELSEMTMRAGRINDRLAQTIVNTNKNKWAQGEIVGEIEHYTLRKSANIYSLWDDDAYVASASLSDEDAQGLSLVNLMYVAPEYRAQGILSKLLWNFKTRQNRSKLVLQQVHSDDLYTIIANGGLSRFNKHWINANCETQPFDLDTLNQFYRYDQPSGWRLVLENTGDLTFFPKFSPGEDWILEDYSWQIR